MIRSRTSRALAALLIAFFFSPALVGQTTIEVTGTNSQMSFSCLGLIPGFTGVDCAFDGTNFTVFPTANATGPVVLASFHAPGDSPFDRLGVGDNGYASGDGNQTALALIGTLTVDDQGSPCDADDTIAFDISYAAGRRNFGGGPGTQGEESWGDGDLGFALAATQVSSAAANGAGGCDWVIGDAGAPPLITANGGANVYGDDVDIQGGQTGGTVWEPNDGTDYLGAQPSISQLEIGTPNVGAQTGQMTVTNGASYECRFFSGGAAPCPAGGAHHEIATGGNRAAIENTIVVVSTDASGAITLGQVYTTDEQAVGTLGAPQWNSPLWTFTSEGGSVTEEYDLTGSTHSEVSNTCVSPVPFFTNYDCSYDGSDPTFNGFFGFIGPSFGAAYYQPGNSDFDRNGINNASPPPGDGKSEIAITGSLVVDTAGTPGNCSDDLISGTLILDAATRNFGEMNNQRAEETWSSVTHTLDSTLVDNGFNVGDGCQYTIGSEGFPQLLNSGFDTYPSEIAANIFGPAFNWWAFPEPSGIGVGTVEGNFGASTSAFAEDWSCLEGTPDQCNDAALGAKDFEGCTGTLPNACGSFGWENLILRLTTDGDGGISGEAFAGHEYSIFDVNDSWFAATLNLVGTIPGSVSAINDNYLVLQGSARDLPVTDNDVGFDDPVSMIITVAPNQGGTAVVVGSPGNQDDLFIQYTPDPAFSGIETFEYELTSGITSDTATVTVSVEGAFVIDINGTVSASENECKDSVIVGNLDDCTYNRRIANSSLNTLEWVGPLFSAGYYTPGSSPFAQFGIGTAPTPADGKTAPVLGGQLIISDNFTPTNRFDDKVSGTFVIGTATRNFNGGTAGRGEEMWASVTHTLAPTRPQSIFSNGSGGYTYRISTGTLPPLLTDQNTGLDTFPSEIASNSTAGQDFSYWNALSFYGISPGGESFARIGTRTQVSVDGYTCADALGGTGACASGAEIVSRGDTENFLIEIVTDLFGNVTSARAFAVQEFEDLGQNTSWEAGTWDFTGDCETGCPNSEDDDADGVPNIIDNCIEVPNGPLLPDAGGNSQLDTDNDGFGNICDADYDNSNFVNFGDINYFRGFFGTTSANADIDGNGVVNFGDLNRLRSLFGKQPGPKGQFSQ